MIDDLGESAKLVLASAQREAADLGSASTGPGHLFLGVAELEDLAVQRIFQSHGVDLDAACATLRNRLRGSGSAAAPFSPEAEHALERAKADAALLGAAVVEAPHILLGVLREPPEAVLAVLHEQGGSAEEIASSVVDLLERGDWTESFYSERRAIAQPSLGSSAGVLASLGRDLTAEAERGELSPLIGRERELLELVQILLGRRKQNAVLIGDPGVGKTAIVEGLAQRIVDERVPDQMRGMRIRTIEVGSLVAGTIYRGAFEAKLKELIDEVRERPDVILFIDEVHMLIGAGEAGAGSMDAANMLKPVLSEGKLKVIGATTTDEYRRHFEKDKALMRRFQAVVVGEPSREDSRTILEGLRPKYEEFHGVTIDDDALDAAIALSARHMQDRFLPDKAFDLLDRACTQAKLSTSLSEWMPGLAGGEADLVVGSEDIAEVVSVLLEIPIANLTADEQTRLLGMADTLKARVVGQDEAVEAIAEAILSARVGMGDPDRPYGVFLFLGPTGVGKTKLAEEVAAFLFGDRDEIVRIDMSEYMEKHSVSGLIGSPPGYVGFEEGGKLTNAVRAKPYAVVLLDEVEKAHPDVWNLFLQVFEDGRLTDQVGRVVDFQNTVIVMTSNVGARRLQAETPVGFVVEGDGGGEPSYDAIRREIDREVRQVFAPEFINRIDQVIVFRPLSKAALRRIIESLLRELIPLDLQVSKGALDFLVEQSYDPTMGARPARRAIQRLLRNPLSLMLARGEIEEGDAVAIGVRDGALQMRRVRP